MHEAENLLKVPEGPSLLDLTKSLKGNRENCLDILVESRAVEGSLLLGGYSMPLPLPDLITSALSGMSLDFCALIFLPFFDQLSFDFNRSPWVAMDTFFPWFGSNIHCKAKQCKDVTSRNTRTIQPMISMSCLHLQLTFSDFIVSYF